MVTSDLSGSCRRSTWAVTSGKNCFNLMENHEIWAKKQFMSTFIVVQGHSKVKLYSWPCFWPDSLIDNHMGWFITFGIYWFDSSEYLGPIKFSPLRQKLAECYADSSLVGVWTCCLWTCPSVFVSPHVESNSRGSPCLKSLDLFQEALFHCDERFTDTGSILQGRKTGSGFCGWAVVTDLLNLICAPQNV